MADKLKQTVAVITSFAEGETPTAPKLSSITAQLRNAATQLEKAVGDLHGESHPYSAFTATTLSPAWGRDLATGAVLTTAAERRLDITSLARIIGPASNLNPRMLTEGEQTVTDVVPVGVHEFALRYPISSALSGTNPNFVGAEFGTYVAFGTPLAAAGEYTVTASGKVYVVTVTTAANVTYTTNPSLWGGGQSPNGSRFNVMPDPNQTSAVGANITIGALVSGRRTVTLPIIGEQQTNIEGNSIVLDATDINYQVQLRLPRVLTDNFSVGEVLPEGFLYLKNETTSEVYLDAEYVYNDETSFKIGNVELAAAIGSGDRFSALTVGSDITTAIDDLRAKSFHNHDRSNGEPFVSLDGITGFIAEPGNSGVWVPSEIPGNFAPQYLHRDGYVAGVDATLNDSNAIRGPLVMGVDGAVAGSGIATEGTSYPIIFGGHDTDSVLNGISIQRDQLKRLRFDQNGQGGYFDFVDGDIRTDQNIIADNGFYGAITSGNAASIYMTTGFSSITNGTNLALVFVPLASKNVHGWKFIVNGETADTTYYIDSDEGTFPTDTRFAIQYHTDTNTFNIWFQGTGWAPSGNKNWKMIVFYSE